MYLQLAEDGPKWVRNILLMIKQIYKVDFIFSLMNISLYLGLWTYILNFHKVASFISKLVLLLEYVKFELSVIPGRSVRTSELILPSELSISGFFTTKFWIWLTFLAPCLVKIRKFKHIFPLKMISIAKVVNNDIILFY